MATTVLSGDTAKKLKELIRRSEDVGPGGVPGRWAGGLPVGIARCSSEIGDSPRHHYHGRVQSITDLDFTDVGLASVDCVLAPLDEDAELTPGVEYVAVRSGTHDGKPLWWVYLACADVTALTGLSASIRGCTITVTGTRRRFRCGGSGELLTPVTATIPLPVTTKTVLTSVGCSGGNVIGVTETISVLACTSPPPSGPSGSPPPPPPPPPPVQWYCFEVEEYTEGGTLVPPSWRTCAQYSYSVGSPRNPGGFWLVVTTIGGPYSECPDCNSV